MVNTIEVYFDTNFFYDVVDEDVLKEDYNELKSFIFKKEIKAFYSPITFHEIVQHINEEKRGYFDRYRNALVITKDLCGDNILEYPDEALRLILLGMQPQIQNSPMELNRYRDFICSQTSYRQLIETDEFQKCKKEIRKHKKQRKRWERKISDALLTINPKRREKIQKGKSTRITDKKEREEKITSLNSQKFKNQCVDAILVRITHIPNGCLIGTPDKRVVEQYFNRLSAFFYFFRKIAGKVIEHGYTITKNDFDDLNYLVYLGYGSHMRFITYDDKLKRNIGGCDQGKQVIKIDDLLNETV